jgi:nicotinate-nucleotide adenylyltransferase
LGILGGTFDPVHLGHLVIAEDVYEKMGLEKVYFLPAAQNPLKDDGPIAHGDDRLAMLNAALAPFPHFESLDLELLAGGLSYTLDSVRRLSRQFSGARLFWIIGADQVGNLDRWHRINELTEEVEFIGFQRPGFTFDIPDIRNLRVHEVVVHALEISASEIRERIGENLPVSLFLPPEVDNLIKRKGLYQQPRCAGGSRALA